MGVTRFFIGLLMFAVFVNDTVAQQKTLTLNMSDSSYYWPTNAYGRPGRYRFVLELLDTLENQDSFTGKVIFNLKTNDPKWRKYQSIVGSYNKGLKDGEHIYYQIHEKRFGKPDSSVLFQERFVNGVRDGSFVAYRPDDPTKKYYEGVFVNDTVHGIYIFYGEKENVNNLNRVFLYDMEELIFFYDWEKSDCIDPRPGRDSIPLKELRFR